jgi:hypothetical protein
VIIADGDMWVVVVCVGDGLGQGVVAVGGGVYLYAIPFYHPQHIFFVDAHSCGIDVCVRDNSIRQLKVRLLLVIGVLVNIIGAKVILSVVDEERVGEGEE